MDKMMKLKRVADHLKSPKSCKEDSKKPWKKINIPFLESLKRNFLLVTRNLYFISELIERFFAIRQTPT